ncbi:MAG: two pore domain potassium channel family protein [Saprospiraceae bacterium]|nr:two pore domain potassium channel family protein [Saprospiraceae bacterium]
MFFIRTILSFLRDEAYRDLLFVSSFIIAFGTVVYHYVEGWTIIDSLYFSVITLTTIGYGDFSPATDAGKIFTIFYIIVGLGMILNFINAVYRHYAYMKDDNNAGNSSNPLT